MLSFCLQISLQQGMKADTGTLMSLCEKTDNDIRSCINTLQVSGSTMQEGLCVGEPVSIGRTLCDYIKVCPLIYAVPPWSWPQAGGHQNNPVHLCGTEGPEQRLVPSVAGDLPVTTYKAV